MVALHPSHRAQGPVAILEADLDLLADARFDIALDHHAVGREVDHLDLDLPATEGNHRALRQVNVAIVSGDWSCAIPPARSRRRQGRAIAARTRSSPFVARLPPKPLLEPLRVCGRSVAYQRVEKVRGASDPPPRDFGDQAVHSRAPDPLFK